MSKTTWFGQVGSIDDFKEMGAKYLVAVLHSGGGNSEAHSQRVRGHIGDSASLIDVWPGSDWWDNPCMCIAAFTDKVAADECHAHYTKSQMLTL